MGRLSVLIIALFLGIECSAQTAGEATLAELRDILEDEKATARARRDAIAGIGALKTDDASAYLVAAIEGDEFASLRPDLIHALAAAPDGEGVESLLLRLAGDLRDRAACGAAVVHVWRLAVDWRAWYMRFFDLEGSGRHHASAIRALALGKCEGSREFLRSLCLKRRGTLGAAAIRYAAEAWGITEAWDDFIGPYLQPVTDDVMRDAAIAALGRAKDSRFVPMLKKYTDVDQRRKQAATWMPLLAAMDGKKSLGVMVEILDEPTRSAVDRFYGAAKVMEHPDVLNWFRIRGAKHALAEVRHAAIISMRRHPDPRNVDVLARIADRDDDERAAAAILALSRHGLEDTRKAFERLFRHRNPQRAADALDSWYVVCGGDGRFVADLVFHAGESRVWQMRVTAMQILREKHALAARYVFKKNARHARDEVRIAAYEALTWLRDRETVDFLVAALDREKDRPLTHLVAALTNLTGTQWGLRVERWKEWWPKVREGFELPERSEGLKLASNDAARYGFYGIGTDAKAIVFVVDISGSMAGRANTGTATRIARAKAELIAAVRRFDETHRFDVIVYNGRTRAYAGALVHVTAEERAKFEKWVHSLAAGGATNLHDALMAALSIPEVETVFLLADGGASAGRLTDLDLILDSVRRRNRFLRVTVNTIGIGVAARVSEFVRALAAQNRGVSVLL